MVVQINAVVSPIYSVKVLVREDAYLGPPYSYYMLARFFPCHYIFPVLPSSPHSLLSRECSSLQPSLQVYLEP